MNKFDLLKDAIAEFSDRKFGVDRPYTAPLHHLKKEVDEAIEYGNILEFADMLLLLLDAFRKQFPTLNTENLIDASFEKIAICEKRKWNTPDGNGVIEHIRDFSILKAENKNETQKGLQDDC